MQPLQLGVPIIDEKILYLMIVSFVIGVIFLMIYPLIKWFVKLQSVKLLCYMFCSLFTLILFFLTILFVGGIQDMVIPLFKALLQGIAIFGGILFIVYSIYYLLRGKRKQKRV